MPVLSWMLITGPIDRTARCHSASLMVTENILTCRVADLDWRLGRVYFLGFLNPSWDNRTQSLPPGWPVLPP
jgi:hypothetical protein